MELFIQTFGSWSWVIVIAIIAVAFVLGLLMGEDISVDLVNESIRENGCVELKGNFYYLTEVKKYDLSSNAI